MSKRVLPEHVDEKISHIYHSIEMLNQRSKTKKNIIAV